MITRDLLVFASLALFAGASFAEDAAPSETRGAILTLHSADGRQTDAQLVRLVALQVPRGQPASALLPEAKRATFEGAINVGLRGRYILSMEGRGKAKVTLNGNVILESTDEDLAKTPATDRIRLNKGPNALLVEYEFPSGKSDAEFRLYWQSDEFPREPVPPTALTCDPAKLTQSASIAVRQGRELFASMRCVKCHAPADAKLLGDEATRMAELATDAPDLSTAGLRLNEAWMEAWIADPKSLRPDASMPAMHAAHHAAMTGQRPGGGAGGGGWAGGIAAYLATLGDPAAAGKREPVPDDKASITAGGHHFATLGCIGCHTLPGAKAEANQNESKQPAAATPSAGQSRVTLKYVHAKWQREALRDFLLDPQAHYAWIRMPNFNLSKQEANQIAAFLLSLPGEAAPAIPGPPPGRGPAAAQGQMMFQTSGCASCHAIPKLENKFISPPLEKIIAGDWSKGCLADKAEAMGKAPDFALNGTHREALRAFARAGAFDSLRRDTPAEFATRQIRALNCNACHKYDGDTDRWSQHETEVASLIVEQPGTKPKQSKPKQDDGFGNEEEVKEPQIDQSRPDLTWFGDKLKPQWMEQFLGGKLEYKVRPWLTARMPAFPARAAGLSRGLALQHGLSPVAPAEPGPDAELAKLGKRLIGKDGGFSCVQCHGIGNAPATNVFEAQGPNFIYVKERLRKDFYTRWMLKPSRLQQNTRMPQFANDEGLTPFTDLFEGDARKQFGAVWEYLLSGREMKP